MSTSFEQSVEAVGQTLQQAFTRLKDRLMYFTECQLATVEDLHGRPRFPKGGRKRHENIAREMVDECWIHGITRDDAKAAKCPRLCDELKERTKYYDERRAEHAHRLKKRGR